MPCDLSAEEIGAYRGTMTEPGKEQPLSQSLGGGESGSLRAHVNREFPDGSRVLRAKIDMASPNINMHLTR